ncbi:hypothetical protein PV325_010408 [Microctonus aethiopoides]|nr:hypothetical protein PV325_010408 [Microctonus aethiopoides]
MRKGFYGSFRADDAVGVVFTSDKLLGAIGDSGTTELFIDGTFDARPNSPASAQLLVMHVKKRDSGVPVMLALCDKRTKAFYKAIWSPGRVAPLCGFADAGYISSGRPHGGGNILNCPTKPLSGRRCWEWCRPSATLANCGCGRCDDGQSLNCRVSGAN